MKSFIAWALLVSLICPAVSTAMCARHFRSGPRTATVSGTLLPSWALYEAAVSGNLAPAKLRAAFVDHASFYMDYDAYQASFQSRIAEAQASLGELFTEREFGHGLGQFAMFAEESVYGINRPTLGGEKIVVLRGMSLLRAQLTTNLSLQKQDGKSNGRIQISSLNRYVRGYCPDLMAGHKRLAEISVSHSLGRGRETLSIRIEIPKVTVVVNLDGNRDEDKAAIDAVVAHVSTSVSEGKVSLEALGGILRVLGDRKPESGSNATMDGVGGRRFPVATLAARSAATGNVLEFLNKYSPDATTTLGLGRQEN